MRRRRKVRHLEHGLAGGLARRFGGIEVGHRPADHASPPPPSGVVAAVCGDPRYAAVAQNCDAIADREDLRHAVADVDDARCRAPCRSRMIPNSTCASCFGQRRGRLVEDQYRQSSVSALAISTSCWLEIESVPTSAAGVDRARARPAPPAARRVQRRVIHEPRAAARWSRP